MRLGDTRPWRPNVMVIALVLFVVAVSTALSSAFVVNPGIAEGLSDLALLATTGLVAFGKDILQLDSATFDPAEAEFQVRMAQISADKEEAKAIRTSEMEHRSKQLELDHEFRNGQNAAMQSLIDKIGS